MITGIDHIVILTGDLPEATRSYETLGFAVELGGVHPEWGTENALISLSDGSYIELLSVRDPELARRHRLWQRPDGHIRHAGEYGGYALSTDDVEGDVVRIRNGGLVFESPQSGSRRRPDGKTVRWRLAFSGQPDLPFLIQDETPRELRIAPSTQGLGLHARIAEVVVVVSELAEVVRAYSQLLRTTPLSGEAPTSSRASFMTYRGQITLVHPSRGDPAKGYLDRAGPGVFQVVLRVRGWPEARRRLGPLLSEDERAWLIDPARTGGVRIALRPEESDD